MLIIIKKLIMHSSFASRLWCNVWHWKRLLGLKKFENELLLKVLPRFSDKMRFRSTEDLPTRKPPSTAKKLEVCQYARACRVN